MFQNDPLQSYFLNALQPSLTAVCTLTTEGEHIAALTSLCWSIVRLHLGLEFMIPADNLLVDLHGIGLCVASSSNVTGPPLTPISRTFWMNRAPLTCLMKPQSGNHLACSVHGSSSACQLQRPPSQKKHLTLSENPIREYHFYKNQSLVGNTIHMKTNHL